MLDRTTRLALFTLYQSSLALGILLLPVALLVRQDDMTHEEFADYWKHQHSPLAKDIEGVVRYHTVYPTDPEHSEFDGLAELYFETLDDLHEAMATFEDRESGAIKVVVDV